MWGILLKSSNKSCSRLWKPILTQYYSMTSTATDSSLKYYDIGLNLTDPMFHGIYNGKQYHPADYVKLLERAAQRHVKNALVTGSSIAESQSAIELVSSVKDLSPLKLYHTIGVHPCCVNEFADASQGDKASASIDNPSMDEAYNESLYAKVISNPSFAQGKLKELYDLMNQQAKPHDTSFRSIGEIGLDYDRFHYSSKEMQKVFFEEQLKISCLNDKLGSYPLFLHMRSACDDFVQILERFIVGFTDEKDTFQLQKLGASSSSGFYKFHPDRKLVVHSFTGSAIDLQKLLNLSPNIFIGVNGCSLRTEENLAVVKQIPTERLLLETDAPWCEIKRTHASFQYLAKYQEVRDFEYPAFKSVKKNKLADKLNAEELYMVKGRNEPCNMEQVAIVVSEVKDMDLATLIDTTWKTTCKIFGE
ncbi:CCQ_1a_G0001450.mRNA.1.CDS.1 [Saccharomyces cerevisiae]|nr:CCQ_1a_G0001450.mRNA.1.CDS.1 [Saccharomyces cerevisiae]CAI7134204.1 CCQ_1a_G0001450.mRNA.1.CDS.1 [Saccharomyces cerevisiae]